MGQSATTNIAYRRGGTSGGTPVVLLHAIGTDSSLWNAQWDALAGACDIIACDLPGHGMALPPDETPTMASYAAEVVAVMDREGIERAHIVGLSLGGMIALIMALEHPGRVRTVTAADARLDAPEDYRAMWDGLIAKTQNEGMDAIASFMLGRWFGENATGAGPAAIARSLRATPATGFIAAARAIQGLDHHEQLGRIACPALLIVGENDGVLPQRMKDMAALIAGSRLVEIEDAGHLSNIDQPAAFNAALLAFLEENR